MNTIAPQTFQEERGCACGGGECYPIAGTLHLCDVLQLLTTMLTFDSIVNDSTPLPPVAETTEADDALFDNDAWVEPPIHVRSHAHSSIWPEH
jgi:hypothetical protein